MRLWHSLPISTCWWWEVTSARGREKNVLMEQLLFWGEKNVQGCVSQNSDPMNSFLRKVEELGLNASAGHTWNSQDAPGAKLNSGKKRAIWRNYPKKVNLTSEILARPSLRNSTWWNFMISRLWQQNSVEFGEKNVQCWARETYAQMKWILRGEAPETRQRDRAVTGKSANERGRTSFCSRFRSVRNSSILLKTRIFILSGKSVKLHDWPIMGSQLLVQWTTSYFLLYQDCHLFQQQFVFNIEIDGWSSHDSTWQACMREAGADRSWQACHGRPWTSIQKIFRRDVQGESNARYSWLVTTLHS